LEWRRQIIAEGSQKQQAQHFARSLIESRKQLDKSFSVPKINDNQPISELSFPQMLDLHRTMQTQSTRGSFIPSSVTEQYLFEAQHGLREIAVDSEISSQVHLLVDVVASKLQVCFSFSPSSSHPQVQHPVKIFWSIWSRKLGFLTEEFYVFFTKNGFPDDTNLISRLSTIFTDLKRFLSLFLCPLILRHSSLMQGE
jgi:hypothetical protein